MSAETVTTSKKKHSFWPIVMGVLTAAVGVVMMVYPAGTATVTTIFLGWGFVVAAIATLIYACSAPGAGPFFLRVLIAILYGVAGGALMAMPLATVVSLTLALGVVLIIQGGIEFGLAIAFHSEHEWWWLLLAALMSLIFGLMILFEWPWSSGWAIGTMVGAAVLFAGISRIVLAATAQTRMSVLRYSNNAS